MPSRHADASVVPVPPLVDRTRFHDVDAAWLEQAIALRDFLDEHARMPGSGGDATALERRLARWLKSQREAAQAGRLPVRRSTSLDQWVPEWRRPRARAWQATAAAVGLHVARSGEYPSASSPDPEIRRLGTWLRTQRRAQRSGRLDADRETWLELNLPYWTSPGTEAWYGTAERVAEFLVEHGRMPRAEAAPGGGAGGGAFDGGERSLARWVRTQRSAARAGRLDAERLDWLDRTIPAWRGIRAPSPRAPRADRWPDRLAEAAAFVDRHGRLPARTSTADEAERRLAKWICAQREAGRHGRLTDERRTALDAHVPGWDGGAAWRARAEQLAAFAAAHGRLPAVRESHPESRGLAVWLGRQRALANEGRLADGRERWLRLHVPGWRDHHLGGWIATAERLVAFRSEHGRLPTRSAGAAPLERELGVWLNNQRTAQRAGRLGADRLRWLDEQLPQWDDSRFAAWLTRAFEVEEHTSGHGRLPHPRSTNPRSRRLGSWLETQRAAARAGRLAANRLEWLDAHLTGWNELTMRAPQTTAAPTPTAPPAAAPGAPTPSAASNERAARVLREWTERLRTRELPITDDQRRWLDRRLPGWDQQTA